MTELTKEFFEEKLNALVSRDNLNAQLQVFREHLDIRFDLLDREIKDIKQRLAELNKRDLEDSNAFARDIAELRLRVSEVEKQLREQKLKQTV